VGFLPMDEVVRTASHGEIVMAKSGRFRFHGGAATYVGTALLGALITICTLGICYPFALVLRERWRAKHSSIDGYPLVFTGSATALFGNWIKWFLLIVVTFGIYLFWVGPRIAEWTWEHTDFDRSRYPFPLTDPITVASVQQAGRLPIPAHTPVAPPQH
jgi:uncharacterized membrane protein YjgN (DUF898 family)